MFHSTLFLLGLQDGAPYVWDDFATLDEIKAVVASSVLPFKRQVYLRTCTAQEANSALEDMFQRTGGPGYLYHMGTCMAWRRHGVSLALLGGGS